MKDFIEIGNRILDYRRYKSEVALLRQIMLKDLLEYFEKLGFETKMAQKKKYGCAEISYYNEHLDIELRLSMRKRDEEKFV